jgi:hypothetical protein
MGSERTINATLRSNIHSFHCTTHQEALRGEIIILEHSSKKCINPKLFSLQRIIQLREAYFVLGIASECAYFVPGNETECAYL